MAFYLLRISLQILVIVFCSGIGALCQDSSSVNKTTPTVKFLKAVENGDNHVVARLIVMGVDVNAKDAHGETALELALIWQHVGTALLLLEHGANVHTGAGANELMLALGETRQPHNEPRHQFDRLLTMLVDKGIDVNSRDQYGKTALLWACGTNVPKSQDHILSFLLAHGADVRVHDDENNTALIEAAKYSSLGDAQTARCEFLLDRHLDVNATNSEGRTALLYVAGHENVAAARLLLERGADPNATQVSTGWTPVLRAAARGNAAMIRLLLERGGRLHVVDNWGRTPLAYASKSNTSAVVRILLDQRAEIDAAGMEGETPLMLAAGANNAETLQLLLRRGADVNHRDKRGRTPLMWAVLALQIVNPDTKLPLVDLPLASQINYLPTIKLLVKNGADLNARNQQGKTPLMLVEEDNNPTLAAYLKELGAAR